MKPNIYFLLFAFLLFAFLLFANSSFAQRVALHSANGVQHFKGSNSFVDAYNASNSGDTIYLSGGSFLSPDSIAKSLRIYGAGHYPDSSSATLITLINGNITLKTNSDNSIFEGIDLTGNINISTNDTINNILFQYVMIRGNLSMQTGATGSISDFHLIRSVIKGHLYLAKFQNTIVSNSILQAMVLQSTGTVFQNNIFLTNAYGGMYNTYYAINGDYNIINNNIFIKVSDPEIAGTGNLINNNIFKQSPAFSNNYINVPSDSIFVSQSGYAFDYNHNYKLNYPNIFLGNDGTEVGIYGGVFPYKDGALPSNPHIRRKNIAPQTNNNGELQIEIEVSAQDH